MSWNRNSVTRPNALVFCSSDLDRPFAIYNEELVKAIGAHLDSAASAHGCRLIEETRRELARHYLKQRTVELNETAFLLGFEDANSFFRAFQVGKELRPPNGGLAHGSSAEAGIAPTQAASPGCFCSE
jgi:hypothetical protein